MDKDKIEVDWMTRQAIKYVIERKYSSDETCIIFSLISDWRKECEKDETA